MSGAKKSKTCQTRIPKDWPKFPDRGNWGSLRRRSGKGRNPGRKVHEWKADELFAVGAARRDWQKYLDTVAKLSPTPKVR